MTRYEKFLKLVELFAVEHSRGAWPSFDTAGGATGVYRYALRVPEERVPEDFEQAADEFTDHLMHLTYEDMRKPAWLPFGVIDYRRYRHWYEWESLGYEGNPEDCILCHGYCKFADQKARSGV